MAEIGRGTGGSARSVIVTMTACVLVPLFVDTVSHAMCRPPRFFMVFGITLFFCYVEGGLGAIIKLFKVPLKSYFSRDDSENCLFEAEPPDGSQKPKTKSGNSPLVDMRCPVITPNNTRPRMKSGGEREFTDG